MLSQSSLLQKFSRYILTICRRKDTHLDLTNFTSGSCNWSHERWTVRPRTLRFCRISKVRVAIWSQSDPWPNWKTNHRIARGEIRSLVELDSKDFSAVVFPGGFGAAKNLSNFAFEGANLTINTDVEKVLRDFHKAGNATSNLWSTGSNRFI